MKRCDICGRESQPIVYFRGKDYCLKCDKKESKSSNKDEE